MGSEPKTFEEGKNAEELGIDLSREFIVVDERVTSSDFENGDILRYKAIHSDGDPKLVRVKDERYQWFKWHGLAYADETTFNKPKKSFMSTLMKTLRSLRLSKTDRLMEKHELEAPAGVPTSLGLEVMADFLYRKFRDELTTEIQALDEKTKEEEKEAK